MEKPAMRDGAHAEHLGPGVIGVEPVQELGHRLDRMPAALVCVVTPANSAGAPGRPRFVPGRLTAPGYDDAVRRRGAVCETVGFSRRDIRKARI